MHNPRSTKPAADRARRWCAIAVMSIAILAFTEVLHAQCGDAEAGDCCTANQTPACEDAACCEIVCDLVPSCCHSEWNETCAVFAEEFCVELCGGCGSIGAGSCCFPNDTPYCNDEACCEIVCDIMPHCCEDEWDLLFCSPVAHANCGPHCGECGTEDIGDCCTGHDTAFCEDADCCETVCMDDPFCCSDKWDALCAEAASEQCGVCFECGTEQAGPCNFSNPTPYCDDQTCCELVCAENPACCEQSWNFQCVNLAEDLCDPFFECGSSGAGDCCGATDTPYCNDSTCCNTICDQMPHCCDEVWDEACAEAATEQCGVCFSCGDELAGDCCLAGTTQYCDDKTCCDLVCSMNSSCCENNWTQACADLAMEHCLDTCGGCGAPNAGPCCSANDTPGCENVECCQTVCEIEPRCCHPEPDWPLTCVALAVAHCDGLCGECGGATDGSTGNCCTSHSGTGCAHFLCERCVCQQDPFCCDVQWDGLCAGATTSVCADDCPCGEEPILATGEQEVSDCCFANNTAFCSDESCCEAVCVEDPYCCKVVWDECCVNLAVEHCPDANGCQPASVLPPQPFDVPPPPNPACMPDAGECFEGNNTPGCNDLNCCALVCYCDPFCCDVQWDQFCAAGGFFLGDCVSPCGFVGCSGAVNLCASQPLPAFSCQGNCGGAAPGGCWCDEACCEFGDCCIDKAYQCFGCMPDDPDAVPISQFSTCLDACGGVGGGGCMCDEGCCERGDCCPDKHDLCGGCEPPTLNPADITGDGEVNVFDLLELIANWGECEFERCQVMAPEECPGDFNHDGVVDVFDLLFLIQNWG